MSRPIVQRICVFCGSRPGSRPAFLEAARDLGRLLAERQIGLVYGGASVGMMGALANAVLRGGGEVIGVIPESLVRRELAHDQLSELRVVGSMHERKALMAELADAMIALPGGFGTFEELFETITWSQLGLHRKAIGILNVDGFYDGLLNLVEHAIGEGFVMESDRGLFLHDAAPDVLLDRVVSYDPPPAPSFKWLERNQT